jgi:hypothetical protein
MKEAPHDPFRVYHFTVQKAALATSKAASLGSFDIIIYV